MFGTASTGFGAKPATAGFGSTAPAFGSFGGGTGTTSGALNFGSKPAGTTFGTTGTSTSTFGSSGATTTGFGGSTFGQLTGGGSTGFGQTQQKPATAFGSTGTTAGSMFGNTGGFGSQPAFGQPGATSNFAWGGTGGGGATTFGQPSAFGSGSTFTTQPPFQQQAQQIHAPILDAIEKLKRAYAPARNPQNGQFTNTPEGVRNEECSFKYVALNKKDVTRMVTDALLYGNLLEQAEKDNADPDNFVPVEEMGIESLKRRYDRQVSEMKKIDGQVNKIFEVIKDVHGANQQTMSKVAILKTRQLQLNRKVLELMRKIEVIRCHGVPIQETEKQHHKRLIDLAQRMENPLRVVQDMSLSLALHEQPQDMSTETINEEDLSSLIQAIKRQSEGLEGLTEMLRKDTRDIGIIRAHVGPHQ